MSRRSFPPLEGDFTQALLRSAKGDEPSHAAYAKAAAALGVGVGLGISASVPAAAGAAALAGAARWSSTAVAKLFAVCVSGALLVGGGALLLSGRTLPASPVGASAAALGTPRAKLVSAIPVIAAPLAVVPPANAGQPLPSAEQVGMLDALPVSGAEPGPVVAAPEPGTVSAAQATPLLAPRRAARPVVRASGSSGSSGSSLAEQVQSLDRARVALGSGDAGAALLEIAHYRKAWPKGVFLTEASVLEIEALAARGERARAASLASAFVNAHPDSPQAERLRALIPAEKR